MTGVGVIDIYDTIKRSNGEHCGICFRTASARKLVKPVFLNQFQDAMKINNNFKVSPPTNLKVCYMCEALAARAVKFLWAVQLAAVIEKLCTHIETKSRRDIVLGHLNGTEETPSSIDCLQAQAIENTLYRLPRTLSRTDILIVGSDITSYSVQPVQDSDGSDPTPLTHSTPDRQSTKNAQANNVPTHPQKPNQTQGIRHTQRHSSNALVTKFNQIPEAALRVLRDLGDVVVLVDKFASPDASRALALRTRAQDQFALHLIVFFAGNTYVPSIKIQVSSDGVVRSVSDRDLFAYTFAPETINTPKKRTQSPEPSKTQNTPKCYQETNQNLNTTSYVGSKKKKVDSSVVLNSHENSFGVFQMNNQTMNEIVFVDEPADNNVNSMNIVNMDLEPIGNTANDASETSIRKSVVMNKQPLPSTDRVDWEDKIPMDVISFMDATDPNPSERIMQPNPQREGLGVISDVRTVQDDIQTIDSIECIDLC